MKDDKQTGSTTIRNDLITPEKIKVVQLRKRIITLESKQVGWRGAKIWDDDPLPDTPSSPSPPPPALERFVETRLDIGEWMSTRVVVSSSGRVDGWDRTWCRNEFAGFTGGRGVLYADGGGNVLSSTPVVSYGVDGTWIPGKPSDRTDYWSTYLPPDLVERIQGLYIFHIPTPRNRLPEIIQELIQIINDVVDAVIRVGENIRDALKRLCEKLPELCAVFQSAFA